MTPTPDLAANARAGNRRPLSGAEVIVVTTLGNALEFFDFTAYNFFAILLGKLFFPSLSPLFQLVMSTGMFAVGYFFRPLGGVLIGIYADRVGRKAAMTLTVALMAISSAMIGLAPTYAQIGVLAPCMILLSRIMQGISAGGEVGASTALLVEYAGKRRRAYFGSFQFASQSLGIALGAVVSAALAYGLAPASLESWGWRLPFLIGTIIAPVGIYIRVRLMETLHHGSHEGAAEATGSVLRAMAEHAKALLTGTVLTFGGTSANFIILFSLPIIAVKSLGMAQADAVLAGVVTGLTGFVVSPLGGLVADRFGRKPVILLSRLCVIALVVPLFVWLAHVPTLATLLVVEGILAAVAAFGGATAIGSMTELFPREARATGMAIIYSVGVALAGVVAQFVATYFVGISSDIMPAAWYVVVCTGLTSLSLLWLPETGGPRPAVAFE
ncbi:MFS transporter [Chitinasiproducens palmae]|uniref:Predicted arabinose efflux permease, MFS family n=1 Tax=Chitinasiproducens palmae TaxID=1770053 RepID=A0A1H2PK89_9BURK|nr:MFS transporter [Chitinasiproducens palmae]SDV46840.1 Predicted arabinose efflux permease, MFS family [Chitinasiproducens palmae]